MDKIIIGNPRSMGQLVLFEGLMFGTAYPTDIDMMMEYHNIGYVFVELKYNGSPVKLGQRLALERLAKDCYKMTDSGLIKKPSISIVADHVVGNPANPIYATDCVTRSVFFGDDCKWHEVKRNEPLHTTIESFLKYCDSYEDKISSKKVRFYC